MAPSIRFASSSLRGFLVLALLSRTDGRVIDGFAVKGNKNVAPVLGRGYSYTTGMFLSKCLSHGAITPPSFDYTFHFRETQSQHQIDASNGIENKLYQPETPGGRSMHEKSKLNSMGFKKTGKMENSVQTHLMFAEMKIDKYYASMDESESVLDGNVQAMLARQDFLGVISACGPSYVRGIRRTAELIVSFEYSSVKSAGSTKFENSMRSDGNAFDFGQAKLDAKRNKRGVTEDEWVDGGGRSGGKDYLSVIKNSQLGEWVGKKTSVLTGPADSMRNRGMGYVKDKGKSLDKFMRKGDKFMRKKVDKLGDGSIKMEASHSLEMSYYANFSTLKITVKAFGLDMSTMRDGETLTATSMEEYDIVMQTGFRMMATNPFTGSISSIEVVPWTFNAQFQAGIGAGSILMYTPPNQSIQKPYPNTLKLVYFLNNAEHFIKLEHIARYKSNMIHLLSNCMNFLWSMSGQELCHTLIERHDDKPNNDELDIFYEYTTGLGNNDLSRNHASAFDWREYGVENGAEDKVISSSRLKWFLDGMHEQGSEYLIETVSTQYSNWMTHYFGPCLTKLSEQRYNMVSGNMFTSHWMSHPQCNKVTCLMESAIWDTTVGANKCTLNNPIQTPWTKLLDSFCMPIPIHRKSARILIFGGGNLVYYGSDGKCNNAY